MNDILQMQGSTFAVCWSDINWYVWDPLDRFHVGNVLLLVANTAVWQIQINMYLINQLNIKQASIIQIWNSCLGNQSTLFCDLDCIMIEINSNSTPPQQFGIMQDNTMSIMITTTLLSDVPEIEAKSLIVFMCKPPQYWRAPSTGKHKVLEAHHKLVVRWWRRKGTVSCVLESGTSWMGAHLPWSQVLVSLQVLSLSCSFCLLRFVYQQVHSIYWYIISHITAIFLHC